MPLYHSYFDQGSKSVRVGNHARERAIETEMITIGASERTGSCSLLICVL